LIELIRSLTELKENEAVLIESVNAVLRETNENTDTELNRIEDLIIQLDEAICLTRTNYLENKEAAVSLILRQNKDSEIFQIEQTANAPRIANFLAIVRALGISINVNHNAYDRWANKRIYLNNILAEMDNKFKQIKDTFTASLTEESPTYKVIVDLIVMLEAIDDRFFNNVIGYNAFENYLNDLIANISENNQRTLAFLNLLQTLKNPLVRVKYNELTYFSDLLERFYGYCYQLMSSSEKTTFSLTYHNKSLNGYFKIQNSAVSIDDLEINCKIFSFFYSLFFISYCRFDYLREKGLLTKLMRYI